MTLRVHTARVSYAGPDRLDVTRKSAGPDGIAFAPSWAILRPALDALRCAEALRAASECGPVEGADPARFADAAAHLCHAAGIVREATWALYREAYAMEMRKSYRANRPAWDALLARESVTLVCYCVDPAKCHRALLAAILVKLGARDMGERGAA